MNTIDTIRYMGIKTKLLDYIVPEINKVTPCGGVVLDIMAGSNSVGYALKDNYTVYTNDIQEYSKTISDALVINQTDIITKNTAIDELSELYNINRQKLYFRFFYDTYSGTYFSKEQCLDIDSIRYAIESIDNNNKKSLYLLSLMGAMCKVQSTPGHFAQFMPATHSRIIPLQKMNLYDEFINRCDLYSNIVFSKYKNKSFCMDYHDLLKSSKLHINTIYLDSPYTQEQYSRFYHVLETVVKYDCPSVNYKAKYRTDRFQSSFCYKKSVESEFKSIFEYCKNNRVNLVVSYSNKGLISVEKLVELACNYFDTVSQKYISYSHSTQGKGSNKIQEILLTCYHK